MKIIKRFFFDFENQSSVLYFGMPETQEEYQKMFSLRYEVYRRKGYIREKKEKSDRDKYDDSPNTSHFIAVCNGEVIGTVRLITDTVLPIKKYFEFDTPHVIRENLKEERAELGRLVIAPYLYNKHLPRNITLLILTSVLLDFEKNKDIKVNYAFIKESLKNKLNKLGVPFYFIENYVVKYPKNGFLHPYFYEQLNDPVHPVYFLVDEYEKFLYRILDNMLIFQRSKGGFILRSNLYTHFLKIRKII